MQTPTSQHSQEPQDEKNTFISHDHPFAENPRTKKIEVS
jgi:hypothetical protein